MSNMPPNDPPGDSPEDRELNRLVREAMQHASDSFRRPADESITAYLLGVATDKEVDEVQAALASSAAFRAEMREAAREQVQLESDTVQTALEGVTAPPPPPLGEFLEQHSATPQGEPKHSDRAHDFLESVRAFFALGRGIGFAAAAAVTAVVAILVLTRGEQVPFGVPNGEVTALKWGLHVDFFPPALLRSGGLPEVVVEETAREAAMASFQEVIAFKNRRFVVEPSSPPIPSPGARGLVLKVLDQGGSVLARFTGDVPSTATEASAIVLLLRVPSPKPYAIGMASDSVDVTWTGSMPDSGAVTFVYRVGRQYGASPAVPFRFE